jgi:hypothetical protein
MSGYGPSCEAFVNGYEMGLAHMRRHLAPGLWHGSKHGFSWLQRQIIVAKKKSKDLIVSFPDILCFLAPGVLKNYDHAGIHVNSSISTASDVCHSVVDAMARAVLDFVVSVMEVGTSPERLYIFGGVLIEGKLGSVDDPQKHGKICDLNSACEIEARAFTRSVLGKNQGEDRNRLIRSGMHDAIFNEALAGLNSTSGGGFIKKIWSIFCDIAVAGCAPIRVIDDFENINFSKIFFAWPNLRFYGLAQLISFDSGKTVNLEGFGHSELAEEVVRVNSELVLSNRCFSLPGGARFSSIINHYSELVYLNRKGLGTRRPQRKKTTKKNATRRRDARVSGRVVSDVPLGLLFKTAVVEAKSRSATADDAMATGPLSASHSRSTPVASLTTDASAASDSASGSALATPATATATATATASDTSTATATATATASAPAPVSADTAAPAPEASSPELTMQSNQTFEAWVLEALQIRVEKTINL